MRLPEEENEIILQLESQGLELVMLLNCVSLDEDILIPIVTSWGGDPMEQLKPYTSPYESYTNTNQHLFQSIAITKFLTVILNGISNVLLSSALFATALVGTPLKFQFVAEARL